MIATTSESTGTDPRVETAAVPVSVIIPTLNEEGFISKCLIALVNDDYPHHQLEIIVVDGMSTDATCEVVRGFIGRYPNIRLAQNPSGTTAAAMNIGIRLARGDVIVRLDAHAEAPRGHISNAVRYLRSGRFEMVGCLAETVGVGYWGERIAIALSSRFGVGNASYRVKKADVYGEPGWLGVFWKQTLVDVGYYDESFLCNEDDELSYRMRYLGLRCCTRRSDLSVKYFCRTTLGGVWDQYYKFGFWKVAVIAKCRRVPAIRHIVPALFVLSVLGLAVGALLSSFLLGLLVAVLVTYGALLVFGSWAGSQKTPVTSFATAVPAFVIVHTAYGLGFLHGLFSRFARHTAERDDANVCAETP